MNQMNFQNKKIAVIGPGGVGGYLAAMLGKTYRHVTLGARGARLQSLRQNGLILHSDYHGEITAIPEQILPTEEIGPQDYIFICVKNYSLEEVCHNLNSAVTDQTVIIPVMNGTDPGDRTRNILNKGIVIDSLIYIIAFSNQDFSISQQGDIARLVIGIENASEEQWMRVEEVSALLSGAGIDCSTAHDIQTEIWRKYILNCAYNVATACYENTIGQIRNDPDKTRNYEALVNEARQVALAKGIGIKQEHIDAILYQFHHIYGNDATSSLQRDILQGRKSELETFSGYLVREAGKLHVPVPVSEQMYRELKKKAIV